MAPNFDFVTGRERLTEVVNFITQWHLNVPPEDEFMAFPPPEMTFRDYWDFQRAALNRRESWDGSAYTFAFDAATKVTEDQLLSFHITPMLLRMGSNVRAILYHHALNRAGLEKSPLRDALSNLHSIVNEAIEHDWLHEVDFENLQYYMGDHPNLAEAFSGRKFRQLAGIW